VIVVVLLGIAVLMGCAVVLSMADGGLHDEPVDHADLGLPDRVLTAEDLPQLRFRTVIRGYRMQDVDAALDRVAQALRASPPPSEPTNGP
jgi:DivIVA domain-containing protein